MQHLRYSNVIALGSSQRYIGAFYCPRTTLSTRCTKCILGSGTAGPWRKDSRNSHRSAGRREPQAGAGQAHGITLLRFGWSISDNSLLCQPAVGFQAELDVASIWERVRVFKLTGCPSIFLGTVSLSNRRRDQK